MGTSNSFGGSGTWFDTVNSLYDAAGAQVGSAQIPIPIPIPTAALNYLGGSLGRGDRRGKTYNVRDLINSGSSSGSSSSGDGRAGGASPTFTRQAARGALVLSAFEALRAGEVPELQSFGIDFTLLNQLSGRELFVTLIQLILGPPAHPDDVALQRAIQITLQTTSDGTPTSMRDLIGRFVGELAWQSAAVQLAASPKSATPARSGLRAIETRMKTYIAGKVRQVAEQLVGASPQVVANYASGLAARVCRAFRKETGTA